VGRFKNDLIERADVFSYRMVDVAEALGKKSRSRRIVDQIIGCGTSVGANTSEADEAVSRADFCKSLGIIVKELNECRYWLRFVAKREWLPAPRLELIQKEAAELKLIYGAILSRSRRKRPD
jgi:four helix bundle protein